MDYPRCATCKTSKLLLSQNSNDWLFMPAEVWARSMEKQHGVPIDVVICPDVAFGIALLQDSNGTTEIDLDIPKSRAEVLERLHRANDLAKARNSE